MSEAAGVNVDPWFHRTEIVPGSGRLSKTADGWSLDFRVRAGAEPCDCALCRPVELSPSEAEMIDARRRSIEAIAGRLGVPPALLTLRALSLAAPLDRIPCP